MKANLFTALNLQFVNRPLKYFLYISLNHLGFRITNVQGMMLGQLKEKKNILRDKGRGVWAHVGIVYY